VCSSDLKIRDETLGKLVPALTTIHCTISEGKFRKVLAGTDLKPFDLAHVPDFNSLIAISQQLSKPVFALTDQEIADTGRVYGYVKDTMGTSRDSFNEVFSSLAERVISLTK
jgi:hypothetical protein